MNRMEFEQQVISEGKKRNILIKSCDVYDRGTRLDFCVTLINENRKEWICKHTVEELLHDIAPIERQHQIQNIRLDHREFKVGDKVQCDNLWIKLEFGEKEPKDMDVFSCCGQFRSGWVAGKVVETPQQNDIAVAVIFDRTVYLESETNVGWIGHVDNLKQLIREDKIKTIEKGEPVYHGSCSWGIRKI